MAKKPKQPKRAVPKRPMAGGGEPGPVAARNVILERMEEQQRVVIEAVTMTRESLERKIDDLRHELPSRIDVLDVAVRMNSADIQSLSNKLDTKADAARVVAVERRVEALEADGG